MQLHNEMFCQLETNVENEIIKFVERRTKAHLGNKNNFKRGTSECEKRQEKRNFD